MALKSNRSAQRRQNDTECCKERGKGEGARQQQLVRELSKGAPL